MGEKLDAVMRGRLKSEAVANWALFGVLAGPAFAAYSVFGLPGDFAGVFALIVLIICILKGSALRLPGYSLIIFVYFGLAAIVGALMVILQGPLEMPRLATSSYATFLLLRFVGIAVFAISVIAGYSYGKWRGVNSATGIILPVSALVCIVALYIYAAQLFGLWEPPRNRIGTGGQDFTQQQIAYSFSYHRLVGSFREPSHLAIWLVPSILLVALVRPRLWKLYLCVFIPCLFLTGSTMGFLMLSAGLAYAAVVGRLKKSLSWFAAIAAMSMAVSFILEGVFSISAHEAFSARFDQFSSGGLASTNRGFIMDYLADRFPPIFGYGVGNANIWLAKYLGNDLMPSHSSFYVNMWFSLGLSGLLLAVAISVHPIVLSLRRWHTQGLLNIEVAYGSIGVAFTIALAGQMEELSAVYGIYMGLCLALFRGRRMFKAKLDVFRDGAA